MHSVHGYIYKITNNINGKIYIGKTTAKNPLGYIKREHFNCSLTPNRAFHKAIRKYGKENFTAEIIDKASTDSKLNDLERFYIRYYRSQVKYGTGYNVSWGGDGGCGFHDHPEKERLLQQIREQAKDPKYKLAVRVGRGKLTSFKEFSENIENDILNKKWYRNKISIYYKIDTNTVDKWLIEIGLTHLIEVMKSNLKYKSEIIHRGSKEFIDNILIVESMLKNGTTLPDISKKINIPKQKIEKWIKYNDEYNYLHDIVVKNAKYKSQKEYQQNEILKKLNKFYKMVKSGADISALQNETSYLDTASFSSRLKKMDASLHAKAYRNTEAKVA